MKAAEQYVISLKRKSQYKFGTWVTLMRIRAAAGSATRRLTKPLATSLGQKQLFGIGSYLDIPSKKDDWKSNP
jgi:hypothetical protein